MSGDGVERYVSQIREFAKQVDHPDRWMIIVPTDEFGGVKERLDTEGERGSVYRGINLCYDSRGSLDEVKVKYRASLPDHLGLEESDTESTGT